jgi:hypothetical protein
MARRDGEVEPTSLPLLFLLPLLIVITIVLIVLITTTLPIHNPHIGSKISQHRISLKIRPLALSNPRVEGPFYHRMLHFMMLDFNSRGAVVVTARAKGKQSYIYK